MSKRVFIKDNSPEIRKKLKDSGFSICVCAEFEDSVWLYYRPDSKFPYDIHGDGYPDDRDYDEFYETVEEFLEKYGNKKH